jgi:hypothetical protein
MGQHARGRLGPAGRVALVRLMVEDGLTEGEAAVSFGGAGDGAQVEAAVARCGRAGASVGSVGV